MRHWRDDRSEELEAQVGALEAQRCPAAAKRKGLSAGEWARAHDIDGPTNRPFAEWPKVFPDPLNAQVIAERLTERSEHFVLSKGYRTRS